MTMKHLMESWRSYEKKILAEKQVLDEISYEYAEEVEDWLAANGDELALPFKDLFDNQRRIVIPLGSAVQPGTQISDFVKFFESNGYKVDFSTGLASKEITDREGNPRLKQQKLGKLLASALKYSKKIHTLEAAISDIGRALNWEQRDDPEWNKKKAERSEISDRAQKVFPKINEQRPTRLENLVDFWNKKSQFYRENPEKAFVDYSIIVSRMPIDVLRMSDYDNIDSCHTEGRSHFNCARAEARGHGPIAYAVETRDLEQIDLDDDEIFEDRARDVDGIEPVARVRLRKFTNQETDQNLAVPEKRTYGASLPNFTQKMRDWALENQKGVWEDAIDSDSGEIDPKFMRQFVRTGGSYEDNSDGSLFTAMFKNYGASFSGNVPKRETEEDDEYVDEEEARYERNMEAYRDWEYRASRYVDYVESACTGQCEEGDYGENIALSYELAELHDYDNPPEFHVITGHALFKYPLNPDKFPIDDYKVLIQLSEELSKEINFTTEITDIDIDEDGEELEIRIDFNHDHYYYSAREDLLHGHLSGDYPHYDEPGEADWAWVFGMSELSDAMGEDAENYRARKEEIYDFLLERGYTKPTAARTLMQKLEAGELEFKHFEVTEDNEGYNISLKTEEETKETGVEFPTQVTTYRAPKTTVGPIKYPLAHSVAHIFGDLQTAGGSQRYYTVSSKKFTRQVMDLLTPEINTAVKAVSQQLKLDLKENTSITPQAVEEVLLDGFVLKMREIERPAVSKGWDKHGERKDVIPGRTPVYVDVEELYFVLDDEDEYEVIEPIIGFLIHLDKNIDKLFDAITNVLQLTDTQYGNTVKDGQKQINQLVGMATEIIEFAEKASADKTSPIYLFKGEGGSIGDKVLRAKQRAWTIKDRLTRDQPYIDHYLGIQTTKWPLDMSRQLSFAQGVTIMMRNHADMKAYWMDIGKEKPEPEEAPPEEEEEREEEPEWRAGMPTPLAESLSEKLKSYLGKEKPLTLSEKLTRYLDEQTEMPSPIPAGKIRPAVYIGDSMTQGMKSHIKRYYADRGVPVLVLDKVGSQSRGWHEVFTSSRPRRSWQRAAKKQYDAFVGQHPNAQFNIGTLGGNAWGTALKGPDAVKDYSNKYTRFLFQKVKDSRGIVGGTTTSGASGSRFRSAHTGTSRHDDLKNLINTRYKALAAEVGVPYYDARSAKGSETWRPKKGSVHPSWGSYKPMAASRLAAQQSLKSYYDPAPMDTADARSSTAKLEVPTQSLERPDVLAPKKPVRAAKARFKQQSTIKETTLSEKLTRYLDEIS